MNAPSELETSAPVAPPSAPETRFLRVLRRVLFYSVISIPIELGIGILVMRTGFWWIWQWMGLLLMISLCTCLVTAILRLGHALWVNAQYAMSELMFTFFSAAFVSMLLTEWMRSAMHGQAEFDTGGTVIAVVVVTFGLFLAGSAWTWGVFRRAPQLKMNRYLGLFCGWISAMGLLCCVFVFLTSLAMVLSGERIGDMRVYFGAVTGMLLVIPGILIERAARRAIQSALAVAPASIQGSEAKDSPAA